MTKKANVRSAPEIASSREVVEVAIEKSKDGRGAKWEKPASGSRSSIPRWGKTEQDRHASLEDCGT